MPGRRSCRVVAKQSLLLLPLLAGLVLSASDRAEALFITPTFDPSITAAPNASAIENSIQSVIDTYNNVITDPIDISIYFTLAKLPPQFVSQSLPTRYSLSYRGYTLLLAQAAADTLNPILATAVANLASGNKAPRVGATSANIGVLGIDAPGLLGADGVLGHGSFDGVIELSTQHLLQYSRPVAPGAVDARWAVAHEINEVLGVGGDVGQVSPSFILAEDLFRYAAPGIPSLTESPAANEYFSIDGGRTALARFNQDQTFDHEDWAINLSCQPPVALVQAAAFCPALSVDMTAGSPEALALQAIGYDIAAIPEPATGLVLLAALGGLAVAARAVRQ